MQLHYYKHPIGNFGDDLNPWLWPRLCPEIPFEVPHPDSPTSPDDALLVGIGTILNAKLPEEPVKAILGSGHGYGDAPQVDGTWRIYFVRGPLTARALRIDPAKALTDAAMLVQGLVDAPHRAGVPFSFMPHHSSHSLGRLQDIVEGLGVRYIDPGKPVEDVLADIASTSVLLTEAMHGAIIADALRVPWVPLIAYHQSVLEYKWQDWCGSLQLPYRPVPLPPLWRRPAGASVAARLRGTIKERLFARALRRVMRRPNAVLSDERTLARVTGEMRNAVNAFREDFDRGLFGPERRQVGPGVRSPA